MITLGASASGTAANFSDAIAGLTPGRTCHFTCRATNATGDLWATNVLSFTTLAPLTEPWLFGEVAITDGLPRFNLSTVSGDQYRLLFKDELASPFWSPVIAPLGFPPPQGWCSVSTGDSLWFTDFEVTAQPQRFYRFEATAP